MSKKTLSVGCLNTVYGTNGHRFLEFLLTHGLHLRRRDDLIDLFNRTRIGTDFVDGVSLQLPGRPDVVVLAEVLGQKQRNELEEVLRGKEYGYEYFHHGKGQALSGPRGYSRMHDETLIASRRPLEVISLRAIAQNRSGQHGNGGGLAAVHLPDCNCNIYAGHFPLRPESFKEQAGIMTQARSESGIVSGVRRHEILLGDFNMSPEQLRADYAALIDGLRLVSPNQKTCNTTRFIQHFFSKCFDHIYASRNIELIKSGIMPAQSDHHGVYANLRF